jgi:hypothetical protein
MKNNRGSVESDICEKCGKVGPTFQFKNNLQCDDCLTESLKREFERIWKALIAPGKVHFYDESEKGEEKRDGGFFSRFSGKNVRVTLLSGATFTGLLQQDKYNKYDVLIESKDRSLVLIPKHAIAFLQLVEEDENK